MRPYPRAVAIVALVSVTLSSAAAASDDAAPAGPDPVVSHQVVSIVGAGGRGAGFMDYTDDACSVCDGKIVAQLQGLTPGATYRLAASPEGCGTTFQKSSRIFSVPFSASARGTWWSGGTEVTFTHDGRPVAIRVLKGARGTTQVGCGVAVDLVEDFDDADGFALIGRFGGQDRRGLMIALEDVEGSVSLTTAFQSVPGDGPLRSRGVSGGCSTPLDEATIVLRVPAIGVTARGTAFDRRVVDLEPGAKPADIDSFRLGRASPPFDPIKCRDTLLLGIIAD